MFAWMRRKVALGTILFSLARLDLASAQPIDQFYQGKTIHILVGTGTGSEYNLFARLVARHLGRHIPGNPMVIVQNIVGAGGLKMLNYLYNQATPDGTSLAIIPTGMPAAQAVGLSGIQFDLTKLNWLGSIAPAVPTMVMWNLSGVRTVDDARGQDVVVGASSRQSDIFTFPAMMNEFLGTRFKIVTRYKSVSALNLALERNEVAGRMMHWSTLKTTKPGWVKLNKVAVIVRAGPKIPDLDVPAVEDLAKTPDDRKVIELLMAGSHVGRPFATGPGVPRDRAIALRAAFDAVMIDRDFLAAAKKARLEVAPITGQQVQTIVERIVRTPRDVAARAKHLLQ